MNIGIKHNNENIFTRAIIAGVLNLLNNGMSYEQYHCDGESEVIDVPWFYNMSGEERFMQDFFTHYDYCLNSKYPKPISGNFDMIPRGVLTYTGSTIAQDALTSRFVKGNFYKEVNGKLESYTSYLFSIPLNIQFTCDMWVDNFTNALRLEEIIRETFYKTQTIYVYYKGIRIGAQVGFPESVTTTKSTAYSFESERNIVKMSFSLEVESYQPCFDKTTEYPSTKVIKGIGINLIDKNEIEGNDRLFFTSPSKELDKLYCDTTFLIEWNYTHENAIIHKIDLSYVKDGQEFAIVKGIPNHMMYAWKIPNINDTPSFNVLYSYDGRIIEEPAIKIVPNEDGRLTEESFMFLNDKRGMFDDNSNKIVEITLEYINKEGKVSYTNDGDIVLSLNDGIVDKVILNKDIVLDINNFTNKSVITLKAYSSTNKSICCESDEIEIL